MENLKSVFFVVGWLAFTCVTYVATAQQKPDLSVHKTSKEKLKAWADYCDEFLNKEDYAGLHKVAAEGLAMTPKEDAYNLSLFNFYKGITFNYSTESDSAVHYLELSEQYARTAKHSRRITEALKQLLSACNSFGKTNKRERVLRDLQVVIDTCSNPMTKALLQESIADYYSTNGQYEKALELQLGGIHARRSTLDKANHTDSINFAVILIGVAELYNRLDQSSKSIEYLRESESFIKDYQEGVAHLYKDYVDAFIILDRMDSAKLYYQKMQTYLSTIQSDVSWSNLVAADLAIAEYYLSKQNLTEAQKFVLHAESIALKLADPFTMGELNYMQGKLSLVMKQYPQAISYLLKAEPVMKEGTPEVYNSLQKVFAEAYAATGNWSEAYKHLHIHAELNDSLRTEASKRNIAEMEAKYQNGRKQEKIEGLSTENALQSLQLENAHQQRIYFIIGLLLLLGMIVSMILIYLNKQKSSKLLEKKNQEMNLLNEHLEQANITKAKLFSIISHDLRNPISQVYQFLDLQKTNAHLLSEADKQAYNDQISAAAGVVLETMEDLLIWSKTQMQQFNITVERVNIKDVVLQVHDLLQAQLDQKQIELKMSVDPPMNIDTDRNIIMIILRNLLQNAMTYSPTQSSIMISTTQMADSVSMTIDDEGAGMPERIRRMFNEPSMAIDSNTSGLGLTIVKEMAELIHAQIDISSNQPRGTRIVISIPNLPQA